MQDTAPGQFDPLPTFTIQPGEFVIIAGRTNAFLELHPTYSGQLYEVADGTIGSGLNTFGDGVILRDETDAWIDAVSYGASTGAFSPSVPVPPSGSSIERNPANNDTNTHEDWAAQSDPNPGSGNLPTGLQQGDVVEIIFDVEINCDAVSGQFFSRVGFEQPPGNPGTEIGSAFLPVNRPDIVVKKTPILQPAGILDSVTWTVRVENAGFGVAQNVVLRDTLGAGLEFTNFSVNPTNSVFGSNVVWDASVIPELAALGEGEFVEVEVTAQLIACSNLFNQADAHWGCSDLQVLPNETCEDTALENETATAGINFIDRYPRLRGSVDPTPLGVVYCTGSSLTIHLTNQPSPTAGPASDIVISSQLPPGWTITGDQVDVDGNILIDLIEVGNTTSIVVNVEAGGGCPIPLTEQPIYFFPEYGDGCGNPYFGPLLFAPSTVIDRPFASIVKIMQGSATGDDGTIPVQIELTYDNFVGTEEITITDVFPSHASLSVADISAGGVLSGGAVIWSNLVPGAGSGVLTTSFDLVISDPCAVPSGATLFNQVFASTYTDCQGCSQEVAGDGFMYPLDLSLGVGCPDPGFTNGCSFASSKSVSPSLVEVCEPVTITHVFEDFAGFTDWSGMTFSSDLAGGSGYLDTTNDVVVVIDGTDVTSFVTVTSTSPSLDIDLSGLSTSGSLDPTGITSLTIEWPVSVSVPGQFVDVSSISVTGCGSQSRSVVWSVGQSEMEIELQPIFVAEACGIVEGQIDLQMIPSPLGGLSEGFFPAYDVEVILDLDQDGSGETSFDYLTGSTIFNNINDLTGDAISGFDPVIESNRLVWTIGNIGTNEVMSINYQLRPGCESEAGGLKQARLRYNVLCDEGTTPPLQSSVSSTNTFPPFLSANLVNNLQPELQFLTDTQIVVQVSILNSGGGAAYKLVAEMGLPPNVSFGSAEITPTTVTSSNVIWEFSDLTAAFGPLDDLDGDGTFGDLPSGEVLQFSVTNNLDNCVGGTQISLTSRYGCGNEICQEATVRNSTFVTISGSLVTRATFPAEATLCQPNNVQYRVRNSGLTIDYDVQAFQTLPLGMTYVANSSEVSINEGPFNPVDDPPGDGSESDPLTWTQNEIPILAALDPGDTVVIRYQVELGCEATLGNSQFISNGQFTDVCGNVISNRQVVSVLQVNEPRLRVNKTSSLSVADLNQTNVYTITIDHHPDSEAEVPYMVLTDVLPSAVTFLGASVPPDFIDGQTLVWSNDTLNALTPSGVAPYQLGEAPIEIVITGRVNNCAGSVINSATVDYGCSPEDNCLTASDTVSLLTSPRLTPPGLTSQMELDTCGGTKTVTVTNTGATAHGLFLTEWAPEGYIFTGASVTGEFNSADLIVTYSGDPVGSVAEVNFTNTALSGATDVKDDRGDGILNLDLGQNSGFVVTWTLASAGENLDCLADPTLGNYIDPDQGDPFLLVSSNLITYVDLCGESGSAVGDTEVFPDIPNLDIAIIPSSLIVTNNEIVNMTVRVVNNSETTDADNIHIRVRIDAGWTDVTITGSNITSSGSSNMESEIVGNDILLDFPGVILNPIGDEIVVNFTARSQDNGQSKFMLAEVVGDCGNSDIIPQCTFTNIFGEAPLADTLSGTTILPVNGQYSSFDQDRFNASGHFLTKTVRLADEDAIDAGSNRFARVGEELIYQISATYYGGIYSNVTITDTMPDEMIYGAPTNYVFGGGVTNALWDPGSGTFTLEPTVITNHPFSITVDIPVTVTNRIDVQDGLTITNMATTAFFIEGVTNTPLERFAFVDILEPNLEITKTVNSNLVQAGDIIIFTNTLSHTAVSSTTAYDIVFTDELPPGLVFNDFIQPSTGSVTMADTVIEFTTNHWSDLEAFTLDDDPIEFVFSVLVVDQIIGAPIFNTSQATYKSLDAESFNGNERTGDDGVDGPLNDYATESTVGLTSEAIRDISKVFFSSTQTNTLVNGTTNDFTIGERFIYEIRVDIPQGIATNVVIIDQVPVGWDWVGSNTNAGLAFPGRGYEFTSGGGPVFPTNVADGLIINDPDASPGDSLTGAGSGEWISFTIPAVTNAADGDLSNDFFTLQLEFVALDVPENVGVLPNPTIGTNVVTVQDTYIALGATSTPYRIVEHDIGITKTRDPETADAGDTMFFTLTVTNSASALANAYNILVTDFLDAGLYDLATLETTSIPTGWETNAVPVAGGVQYQLSTINERALVPGEAVTVEFNVVLAQAVRPNDTYSNFVEVEESSTLYDDPPGGITDRQDTDDDIVTFDIPGLDLSKVLDSTSETEIPDSADADVQIGEVLTYRLDITLPESTITNLTIVDTISNNGLAYIGGSARTETNAFSGVLGDLTEDPSPGTDILSDMGQEMTFVFEGNTIVTAGPGTTDNTFSLLLDYLVLDDIANQNGTVHTNFATLTFDDNPGNVVTSEVVTTTVIEPDVSITKTVDPSENVDAGDIIRVTLELANTGTASAYDILVEDELLLPFFNIGTLTNEVIPTGFTSVVAGTTYQIYSDDTAPFENRALMPGSNVVFEFDITLAQELPPNVTFTNVATVQYDSLRGTNIWEEERFYDDEDEDVLTGSDFELDKVLDSTSETEIPDSTGSNLQIGEVATYRLDITVPEGTITNLTITDFISDNGLAYIFGSASVVPGSFDGSIGDFTELPSGPGLLSDLGQTMTFTFTNVVATGSTGTVNNTFSLLLDYLVIDDPANVDGTVHTNRASITYDGNPNDPVDSPEVTTTVVEPDVVITKTVDPSENLDAGDIIRVTLELSNTGTASAYDILVEDELQLPFFNIGSLTNEVIPTGFTSVVAGTTYQIHSDDTAPFENRALMPGSNVVFEFDITLAQELPPNVTFTNVATVQYDSLRGTNIWEEERFYDDEDEDVLTGSDFEINKVLWATSETNNPPDSIGADVQIGEILTYRIDVTLPEGTITNLTLVDTLSPAGLAYIGQSVQIDTNGFDGILASPLVESPPLAPDALADSGQTMTFTFEGNTIVTATTGTLNNTFSLFLDYLVLDEPVNSGLIGNQTVHTNIVSVTYDNNPNDPVVSGPVTNTVIEPVLSIEKSFSENTVDAGDIVTVTLVVTNSGTATAYDVVIEDDISAFEGVFISLDNITPAVGFSVQQDDPFLRFLSDPAADPGDRVILAGEAKTFTFDVTISESVQPNFTYTNIATVVGDSLSGTNRFDVERTTEDEAEDTLDIPDFEITKELIATSETGPVDSEDSDVQIGEVATYRLTVELPEGEITNLEITDFVPTGMAFVVDSVQIDTNDFSGFLPAPDVSPDTPQLGADGEDVTILFPGVTEVEAQPGTAQNILRITLDLITLDADGNVGLLPNQTILTNIAEITYEDNPAPPSRTPPVPVTVVEPDLAITKTVTPNSGDAGDTIQVTLVLTNSGTATAYDLVVSDELLASIFNIETVINDSMPDGFTFEVVTNAPNATVFYRTDDINSSQPTNALPVGESRTFQFSVNLSQDVEPGQLLTNVAVFQADTIDGTNVFDVDREYEVEDEDTITIDDMEIEKALIGTSEIGPADSEGFDVQIGEVATYRLTVTLPESTITNLTVVDVVPSGMRYVTNSVSVNATGFGGTLPLPPSVATVGGSGDPIAITFEGLTIVDDDNDPNNNSFTIDLDLLVLDVPGNTGTVAGAQTILPNFATIAYDGNPPADTSTVVNVDVIEPLLQIQKTMSEASNRVVFVDLVVTNIGLATAYDIAIEDVLPDVWWDINSVQLISTPTGFVDDVIVGPDNATITYSSDPTSNQPTNTIVAGGSVSFQYRAELIADAPSPVTNVAEVIYTSIDEDGPEDEEREYGPEEDEDILPIPRVSLNKTVTSPVGRAAAVGETVTFEIEVINTGGVGLDPVELVDTFDTTYLSFINAVGAPTTVIGDTITWDNVGLLDVGASTTLVVNFQALLSTKPGDTTNVVVMTSFTTNNLPVPPLTNDAPVEISNPAYVLTKTNVDPGATNSALVGDTITFDILIENTGDVDFVTVPVVDTFDASYLEYLSAVPPADTIGAGEVTWDDIGPLSAGASTNISVVFTAIGSTLGLPETNTVVTAPTTPPNEPPVPPRTNDVPYITARVGYTLDKVVTSPSGRPAIIGEEIQFLITVVNTGDVALVTVPLEDTYDSTFLGFDSAVPTHDIAVPGQINWTDVGPVAVGASTSIFVNFTALADTLGQAETNTVVASPTTPPEHPPVPPSTNDAPYEINTPAALGDYVWFDLNEDGIQDANEPGVPGVTVNLLTNGTVIATTVTDELGFYSFTNLVPSTYVVEFELPDGFVFSPQDADGLGVNGPDNSDADPVTGRTDPVTLASGEVNDNLDAGIYRPLGAIGNYVWLDENSDGFQDAGEPGIPNVRVNLYDADGTLVASTLTDTKGGYLFTDLPSGTYFVDVEDGTDGTPYTLPVTGMTQTTTFTLPNADFGNQDHGTTAIPGGGGLTGYQIDLGPREINLTADFGYNYRPTEQVTDDDGLGAIGDRVWIDTNGDGVQDPGELGVPNVTVTLFYDSNGDGTYDAPYDVGGYDPVRVTDETGHYMFNELPPGAYVVVVDDDNFDPGGPLEGYTQTGDPDFFGQALPAGEDDNRTTMPIPLAPGDVFLNADFGYQPPASQNNSVGDRVWFDANANQVGPDGDGAAPGNDDDEYGIAGVTVALIRDTNGDGVWDPATDPIIATTITDEDGYYLFTGVPDGNYLVWVNDVNGALLGLTQTYDNDGIITPNISAVALDPDGLVPTPVENLEQDFGYTAFGQEPLLGAIGDRVWLDIDSDGNQDPNEPGIPGIVMELYDANTNLIASTVTGADGYYYFGGLETGTYTVVVATPPPGLTQTFDADDPIGGPFATPHQSTVTIGGTEPLINLDQDFGYVGTGRIGDQIWEDRNADGVFDPATESGIPGVTVDLYWDLDGTGTVSPGDPKVGTTVTDNDGNYIFEGLSVDDDSGEANYVVVVTDENNVLNGYWKSTGPNPGANNNSQSDPYPVTLTPAEPEDLTADFGYYVDGAALGNRIWLDAAGDGFQHPVDDVGLGGVTVRLQIIYSNGITNELFTVSDTNGFYSFGNLLLDENHNGTNAASPTFVLSVENPGTNLLGYVINHTRHDRDDLDPWEDSDFPLGTIAVTWQGQTDVGLNQDDPYNPGLEIPAGWYDFGFTPQPTLAVIAALRSRIEEGIAVISWDVSLEVGTVGYYLERWENDEWVRVSDELILADPVMPAPKTYEQADPEVPLASTQLYRILELDVGGQLLEYGPYELKIDGGEISYETWAAGIDWGDADSSPDADPDGDGLTNWQEYLAGTDPLNPNSVLLITDVESVEEGIRLTWPSTEDRTYAVEMALTLDAGFQAVATGIESTPPENIYVLPVSADVVGSAFFRVVLD